MAKHPNSKPKQAKQDGAMNSALKFFLAGCVAELYLLIVRRFYVNGTLEQVVAWDSYLVVLGGIGAAVLAVGALLTFLWKAQRSKRTAGLAIAGAGLFLAGSSFLIHWNMSVLTLLSAAVPVAMVLSILWGLYDRECALSLTVLGVSLVALWICRKQLSSMYLGTYVKVFALLYILALAAVALLVKKDKLQALLPAGADPLPVYAACGLSAVAMVGALFSASVAYYAMWALAIVAFGLAVYYTVKQL